MGLHLMAEISWLSSTLDMTWVIFKVAAGLGFVIFVHELGHFLAAKFFGVKCEKFYVGFDVPIRLGPIQLPAKLFHFQWGETEYGIGSIPLGGYVKMLGQDDDPRNTEKENERIRVANPNQAKSVGQSKDESTSAKSLWNDANFWAASSRRAAHCSRAARDRSRSAACAATA